ncbi:MAG UNVERIFIED_CONTAM: hypothetical protein LVQ98_02790 [Rickettsiaceae bacterium]|jgi:hypothetical protein
MSTEDEERKKLLSATDLNKNVGKNTDDGKPETEKHQNTPTNSSDRRKRKKPGIGNRIVNFIGNNKKAIGVGLMIGTALGGAYFLGAVVAVGAAAAVGYACYKIGKGIARFISKKWQERKERKNEQSLGQKPELAQGQSHNTGHTHATAKASALVNSMQEASPANAPKTPLPPPRIGPVTKKPIQGIRPGSSDV